MNAKERFYSGLAKETIGKITSNTDNWTSFLRTMSRNYEFTYPEQVMIYAQRPNATFCKPYEDWNAENYRRYVKRGSTGIALFVMNRDKPYLRYVFDVADTGVRRSSPELKPWEVTPENRSYVMEAMERTFGVSADGVLEAQLEDIASALAAEYWDDYKKQFLDIVANSFLRLTELVPELLDYVDNKKIGLVMAVDLSYLDEQVQKWVYEYFKENGFLKPVQVEALKNYPNLSNVTQFSVISIMNDALPKKSKESKLSFSAKKLDKYFPPQYSTKERENIIIQLLEQWSADQVQSE